MHNKLGAVSMRDPQAIEEIVFYRTVCMLDLIERSRQVFAAGIK